jgi:hypothetical protein
MPADGNWKEEAQPPSAVPAKAADEVRIKLRRVMLPPPTESDEVIVLSRRFLPVWIAR